VRIVPLAAALATVGVLTITSSCSAPGGAAERAAVLAVTCDAYLARSGVARSGVARSGVEARSDPDDFAAAYRAAVDSGRPFSSIGPLRSTCATYLRDVGELSTEPTLSDADDAVGG
jgi:hypothetical protein